jgi:hypothetical protein
MPFPPLRHLHITAADAGQDAVPWVIEYTCLAHAKYMCLYKMLRFSGPQHTLQQNCGLIIVTVFG